MVRFKVIKGSHIFFAVAVITLVAALLLLGITAGDNRKPTPDSIRETSASALAISANADASKLKIRIIPDTESQYEHSNSPSILIYHTHTHEAYMQDQNEPYEAIETWRTQDKEHNVVRVGAELAAQLREKGFNVVHDTTDHELNDINNSYVRSLETLKSYEQQFDLCIDLHRDAYSNGMNKNITDDDTAYAQVMCLIGQGNNYPDSDKPAYKSNLEFAGNITRLMNEDILNICRNVTVKDGRYNQHIGRISVLVEVGHNQNTLEEALASVPCLANAIAKALSLAK